MSLTESQVVNSRWSSFEDELGVVIYPGTEVMRETEGHQHLARSSGRSSAVLIPQPSDDPHDPLVSYWHRLSTGRTC